MNNKKKIILLVVGVMLLVIVAVGATYAFFKAQGDEKSEVDINADANTVDTLKFTVGNPLILTANQFNFTEGGNNSVVSTTAKATLTANNKTNTATQSYYLYLNITKNEFVYTKDSTKPELLLVVKDPSGNDVTNVTGLTYKTITDGSGASLSGFDVTTQKSLITLENNRKITTTSSIIEEWTISLVFVNYEFNQASNAGKIFEAKIMIQKNEFAFPDINLKVNNRSKTYGLLGTINCDGITATYNQQYSRIEVTSFNNSSSCNLNYTDSTSKVNLATYITGLVETTQGTGQVVNEKGYRYEGKNPNNYVWFNNEYWRIIGVFDESSHGVSGKNLVKIIRADSLGSLVWNKSDTSSDWTVSSLNLLLNGAYYNAQDGTNSGYCYGYSNTITSNCDYTKKGIQTAFRDMIAKVTWHLGGYSSTSATADAFYEYERGTTVYNGNPTSTTGYVGLMYPSDNGYSVLASSCTRTTNLNFYGVAVCAGSSWLYGNGYEWTLTPYSSSSHNVFNLNGTGSTATNNVSSEYNFRPVLYLSASVYKIDGDGSLNSPYIIGM